VNAQKFDAREEIIAYWQFCETRGLRPSINKCVAQLRRIGIQVNSRKAAEYLADLTSAKPHPSSTLTSRSPRVVAGPFSRTGWRAAGSRLELRRRPGVYALFDGPVLLYIGCSRNIRARVNLAHHVLSKYPKATVRVRYTDNEGSHLAAEFRLIRRLKPSMNVTHA
jgi:hypothetical protein